ncbi:hypothetical protein KVH31_13325 [Streptomyces olivaceus]|uniref:hypothetical protein n=1 Tax=Streptomyces olivaceus TaxID=47716 RepID=UPI001CCE202B|nr:hypothetical protein [Streptomyces olivaceus]MBZ6207479.1 hypothetical protein [Streptomyces olivaceus]
MTDQTTPDRCVCGDPIEWRDYEDGSGWIHSPGSDTPCLDARRARPPVAVPAPGSVRELLLAAIDGTRTPPLGYGSPEELLAAYDASRTPAVDPAPPGETAAAVLAVVEAAGGDTLTRDARAEALAGIAAVLPATTRHDTDTGATGDRRARYEAAMVSARRDSSGGAVLAMDRMVDAAMAVADEERENDRLTLEHDRRYIARLDHEYDSLRTEVEAHRLSLSQALGLGTGTPWDAIHERVAELRRVADETAATETQRCVSCDHEAKYHAADDGRCWFTVDRGVPGSDLVCPCAPHQPAAGARQDGASS